MHAAATAIKFSDSGDSADSIHSIEALYHRAFREHGCRALWNVRELERPTQSDALAIARHLRLEGNLAARRLAEAIERHCRSLD